METNSNTAREVDNALASKAQNELPEVRHEPGHITFIWGGYELLVDAIRFDDKGRAELSFWYDNQQSGHMQLLGQDRVDLLSASSKGSLIRQLRDGPAGLMYLPWNWVLTCITYEVVRTGRRDEPVEEVWSDMDAMLTPDYLLKPILYRNHPTVFFGDKGTLKSLLALVVACLVQLHYPDNKLGLTTTTEPTYCLYADYEDDKSSFTRRWTAIQNGFGIEAKMSIFYKRMTTSLADSMDNLRQAMVERNVKLLIVDSLGPAARGRLNDPEPAIEYYQALRALGVTSLTLAHNSKDPQTKKKSIFGSVFFTNLARSIWESKAECEPGEHDVLISLKHTSANLSERHRTLGYTFTFDNANSTITVAKANLEGTNLSRELSLSAQVKTQLHNGARTVKELAAILEDYNENSIRTALNRLKDKEQVVKTGDGWILKEA